MSSFFFQAEDGIRDLTVTGVQTCALPISTRTAWELSGELGCVARKTGIRPLDPTAEISGSRAWDSFRAVRGGRWRASTCLPRSEERRGGKEGRFRWSPDH